jgi:uroporphyrin-III C-methyltransferase
MTTRTDDASPSPQPPTDSDVSGPDAVPSDGMAVTSAAEEAQRSNTWGLLAWLVVFLLALAGLVLSASLWMRTNTAQDDMGRRFADLAASQRQDVTQSEALQAQVRELQSRLSSSEARLSELALQRTQLEDLVRGLSRSRDDSLVQDIESALRMAVLQSQMTGSVSPMVSALQSGMDRLSRADQPRLSPVQVAMEQDLNAIQSAQVADVPRIVNALSDAVSGLSGLPLGVSPPQRPSAVLNQQTPSTAVPPDDAAAPFWQRGVNWAQWKLSDWLGAAGQELHGLIRVRQMDQSEAAVLMPEQAAIVTQQLKMRLLGARVAILNGQAQTARSDLLAVIAELNRFAQLDTPQAQTLLKMLAQLSDELAHSTLPKPEQTLRALVAVSNL